MPKEAYINARVDKRLKAKAEKVLSHVGITTTDAITMLLHQIVLRKGLPFDARIPNEETVAALAELAAGKGEISTDSARRTFDRVAKRRN
jgi:DNA-damage-inducible protein J